MMQEDPRGCGCVSTETVDTDAAQRLHTYTVRYLLKDTSHCVEQMRGSANMQRIMRQYPWVRTVLWYVAGPQRFRQVDRQQPSIVEEFENCQIVQRRLGDYLAKREWLASVVSANVAANQTTITTTTAPSPSGMFHQMTQLLYDQVYSSCRVNDFASPSLRRLAPFFRLCEPSSNVKLRHARNENVK